MFAGGQHRSDGTIPGQFGEKPARFRSLALAFVDGGFESARVRVFRVDLQHAVSDR